MPLLIIMIKIFYCTSDSATVPSDVSEYRKNKILSVSNPKEKLNAIRSALVLKAGFASYGIDEKTVEYVIGEHGKPHSANYPKIHFSLSHTDNIAICAFFDDEIGIDCENTIRNINIKTLNRFFSDSECSAHNTSPLLLWVSKEAIVKQSGKGFANGRHTHHVPPFDDEITVDGLWLKRLEISGALTVICTASRDDISITMI